MTAEEFDNLPYCLRYKEPGSPNGCSRHPNNDDDWDELEDPCSSCGWNKYNMKREKERFNEFKDLTVEEALAHFE